LSVFPTRDTDTEQIRHRLLDSPIRCRYVATKTKQRRTNVSGDISVLVQRIDDDPIQEW